MSAEDVLVEFDIVRARHDGYTAEKYLGTCSASDSLVLRIGSAVQASTAKLKTWNAALAA